MRSEPENPHTLYFDQLPRWRQILVDLGIRWLEWTLPRYRRFQIVIDPAAEKSWVEEVLDEDRRRQEGEGKE